VGNYIGVAANGVMALSNSGSGVLLYDSTVVGTAIRGNVIAANGGHGVYAFWGPNGTRITDNRIGVNSDGTIALGNGGDGVLLDILNFAFPVERTEISGGNIIAHNTGAGVTIVSGKAQAVFGNQIYNNGELGIDLDNDGVTPNDAADTDEGANGLQNYPVLAAAATNGVTLTLSGTLDTISNTLVTIDVYYSLTCDPSGYGEAEQYIGSFNNVTDSGGQLIFNEILNASVPNGAFVTATATDPDGNTSEFAACVIAGGSLVSAEIRQAPGTSPLQTLRLRRDSLAQRTL
jgi:hypothetical protein